MTMQPKHITFTLLILTLMLGACQKTESAPHPDSAASQPVQEATRLGVIVETSNTVSAQTAPDKERVAAQIGMELLPGGSLETGGDGRARIDLKPEGTIVRVAPNSTFRMKEIKEENGQPQTTIELLSGKMFILLKGGSLNVATPSGTAAVRGSLLSVEYKPDKKVVIAACLEGHCSLKNENGVEVELEGGQSSYIEDEGDPSEPEAIDRQDIQDWLDENPDLLDFMDELPNPEDYPDYEYPFDETYNADQPTEEAVSPEGNVNPPDNGTDGSETGY
jgi:hypothetical protein